MRLLLDTNALIWSLTNSLRLSPVAAITDPDNDVRVSPVSGYEIANKQRLGKLNGDIAGELLAMVRKARLAVLPVSLEHTLAAGALPGPHRDPWDRLLMAQARLDDYRIVSIDPVFAEYGLPVVW
jgi:PIN domain nuclease of toxin-antitoxin system